MSLCRAVKGRREAVGLCSRPPLLLSLYGCSVCLLWPLCFTVWLTIVMEQMSDLYFWSEQRSE